jgi:hypothetical protein
MLTSLLAFLRILLRLPLHEGVVIPIGRVRRERERIPMILLDFLKCRAFEMTWSATTDAIPGRCMDVNREG